MSDTEAPTRAARDDRWRLLSDFISGMLGRGDADFVPMSDNLDDGDLSRIWFITAAGTPDMGEHLVYAL